MENYCSRRRFLATAGAALGAATAGCLGSGEIDDSRVVWQREIDKRTHRILVDDGTVYTSTGFETYAVSAEDGTEQWTFEEEDPSYREGSCYGLSLGLDDDRVYLPGCEGLTALSKANGSVEWRSSHRSRQSLALADGTIYAGGEALAAIDAETGTVEWTDDAPIEKWVSPAVTDETVVAVQLNDGRANAYETDGTVRWSRTFSSYTRARPTIADGVVYLPIETESDRGKLFALDLDDGETRWQAEIPEPRPGSRPVVWDDAVYLGSSGDENGYLIAHDRDEGNRLWSYSQGELVTQPALEDETCYAGSNDGELFALSTDGERQWSLDAGDVIDAVAVQDDIVYAAKRDRLFAVDPESVMDT